MYYIIYKTTNLINNKNYIGMHSTNNLDDNYLGSGKLLLQAIKKYGKHNFKREVLEILNSEEEMIKREIEIVNEEFRNRDDTYNIMTGGMYGSKNKNGLTFKNRIHTEETKEKLRKASTGRHPSLETREKMRKNNFARRDPERQKEHSRRISKINCINRKLSNETKKKISITMTGRISSLKGKKKPKIKCPHCSKEGAANVMYRFHFDNCKFKFK